MARFLKNERIQNGSTAIQVPVGDTSVRPAVPVNGQIRFNKDPVRFEIYYNGWKQIAISGSVPIVKDSFTGDGMTRTFLLSQTPVNSKTIIVFVGNVHQNPDDAFTLTGASITFTTAPPDQQTVVIFHGFASTDAN
jgi:hypothetical protein